jgi:hypothetical protein
MQKRFEPPKADARSPPVNSIGVLFEVVKRELRTLAHLDQVAVGSRI